ncbi:MAG TPA: formate/nitrite transporter family protein [Egibacteraceae bacterium]|nr:formate/nitrite transporter family protein [Egibacteraceae bacterium]
MATAEAERAPPDQDEHLAVTFRKSVDEGRVRLARTWPGLLATGFVGGVDVSLGILALLVVKHETGSIVLGALAFTTGFIALTLGKSELFTENYLVPVAAVVAHKASTRSLVRLWVGTVTTNLVGGWVVTGLIMMALPRLTSTAIEIAEFYPRLGLGREAFALGLIGGVVITVMTWMEHGGSSVLGRVVAAVVAGFLLAVAPLNHVIVVSLEMFAALHVGAPFGYAEWLGVAALATVANMVGGLVLVTLLRLVQVGARDIGQRREEASEEAAPR